MVIKITKWYENWFIIYVSSRTKRVVNTLVLWILSLLVPGHINREKPLLSVFKRALDRQDLSSLSLKPFFGFGILSIGLNLSVVLELWQFELEIEELIFWFWIFDLNIFMKLDYTWTNQIWKWTKNNFTDQRILISNRTWFCWLMNFEPNNNIQNASFTAVLTHSRLIKILE